MYAALAPAGAWPDQIDTWLPYQLMASYQGLIRANTPAEEKQVGPPTLAQWQAALAPGVN